MSIESEHDGEAQIDNTQIGINKRPTFLQLLRDKGNNKKSQTKGKVIKTHANHTVTVSNFEELTEARARPLGLAGW
eukprot:12617862-Heterocapsa_arctica.AAC.1